MKPTHSKRSTLYNHRVEKKPSAVRTFIEANTHHNITMKREFVYLEDVKEAININTMQERIMLKRLLIKHQQASCSHEELEQTLFDSEEKDKHRLQKDFHIKIYL